MPKRSSASFLLTIRTSQITPTPDCGGDTYTNTHTQCREEPAKRENRTNPTYQTLDTLAAPPSAAACKLPINIHKSSPGRIVVASWVRGSLAQFSVLGKETSPTASP